MYADVVVLSYQPPGMDSYTYEIPKNLEGKIEPGSLVNVPFGKRNPLGLVISASRDEVSPRSGKSTDKLEERPRPVEIKIKPVDSLALVDTILLPYQIELVKWIRTYYLAPMVNCAGAMLPPIPKKLPKTSYQRPNPGSCSKPK